ncbi:MAG: class I SAM-dependent methyltransferase [Victivallaceae bacterium]|nr:class I SAM-dependent methyltransferase [Victivallaceae bacterium]
MIDTLDFWRTAGSEREFTTDFNGGEFSVRVPRTAAVLDVGCGYGRVLAELYDMGYRRLTGVDISEPLLRRGGAEHPELDLRVQPDPARLDFPDGAFDAVLLCAVLTCIPSDADQRRLIAEIFRVLRRGACFYCNDFLLNDDSRNLARYCAARPEFGSYGVFKLPEGAVLRHHSVGYIRELFGCFKPDLFQEVTYRTMNGHTSRGFVSIAVKP